MQFLLLGNLYYVVSGLYFERREVISSQGDVSITQDLISEDEILGAISEIKNSLLDLPIKLDKVEVKEYICLLDVYLPAQTLSVHLR